MPSRCVITDLYKTPIQGKGLLEQSQPPQKRNCCIQAQYKDGRTGHREAERRDRGRQGGLMQMDNMSKPMETLTVLGAIRARTCILTPDDTCWVRAWNTVPCLLGPWVLHHGHAISDCSAWKLHKHVHLYKTLSLVEVLILPIVKGKVWFCRYFPNHNTSLGEGGQYLVQWLEPELNLSFPCAINVLSKFHNFNQSRFGE